MAALIVPWYGNHLFLCLSLPLDYNCVKDKGSFLGIFVIPAPSKVPGTEMLRCAVLFCQLCWLTHSAVEA